ncbi:unnamed protein product, partial [Vitis vinifera]|uniref:Uncharacterized protein n=1 Tax=Vitis vinifera TaxID=29760 RepID=D7THZ2_VITVI
MVDLLFTFLAAKIAILQRMKACAVYHQTG